MPGQAQCPRDDRVLAVLVDQHRGVEPLAILKLPPEGIMRRTRPPPPHARHRRTTMRSSTPDAPPGQVPAGQVPAGGPAAGTARLTTLTARLAGLASFAAEIAAAILGCPF